MARADLERELIALRADLALLTTLIDELLEAALSAAYHGNPYDARVVQRREEEFEEMSTKIEDRAFDILTLQQPVLAGDLRFVIGTLVVAPRLQRIGHGAFGIARLAVELMSAPEMNNEDLRYLGNLARSMLHDAAVAFVTNNQPLAASVLEREKLCDQQYQTIKQNLLDSLSTTEDATSISDHTARSTTFWLWIAHKLERVADHAVAIAYRCQRLQQ
jgi:phosphate transport system protein